MKARWSLSSDNSMTAAGQFLQFRGFGGLETSQLDTDQTAKDLSVGAHSCAHAHMLAHMHTCHGVYKHCESHSPSHTSPDSSRGTKGMGWPVAREMGPPRTTLHLHSFGCGEQTALSPEPQVPGHAPDAPRPPPAAHNEGPVLRAPGHCDCNMRNSTASMFTHDPRHPALPGPCPCILSSSCPSVPNTVIGTSYPLLTPPTHVRYKDV